LHLSRCPGDILIVLTDGTTTGYRYAVSVRKQLAVAAAMVVAGFHSVAVACPNCVSAMSKGGASDDPNQLGRAYSWSILFMMAMPFVLCGTVMTAFYFNSRKKLVLVEGEAARPWSLRSLRSFVAQ
jgi:hypothetical protein